MKVKRLLNPANSKDGHPQSYYCEIHSQEEIERVCSLSNCRRRPLLCWQCLLDDKEHAEAHRKNFLKLTDFLDKFIEDNDEAIKNRKMQELPPELKKLIEDEENIVDEYENYCENQKSLIEEEFQNIQKHVLDLFQKTIDSLKESIDRKQALFKENYGNIKKRIEDFHGMGKALTHEIILEEINTQKENSSLSNYILNLKQSLLPKIPLLKDPAFTSVLSRFYQINDKIGLLEESSKFKKSKDDLMRMIEKSVQDVHNEIFGHYRLDLRNLEENLSVILKRSAVATNSIKPFDSLLKRSADSNPIKPLDLPIYQTVQLPDKSNFESRTKPIKKANPSLVLKKVIKTSHSKQINAIKVINDELIATASKDKTIKIWKFYSKECVATLEGHKDNVCCLGTLNPSINGLPTLISGGGNFDSSLILWDLESRKVKINLVGHQSSVTTVLSLKDNRTIVSGSYDNNLIFWDSEEAKAKYVIRKHSAMVSSLKVIKDGEILASSSWDKTVALWRLSYDDQEVFQRCDFLFSILENFAILSLATSVLEPNRLIYAGTNKKFYVYNVDNKEKEKEFEGSHFGVNELTVVESNFLDSVENLFVIGLSNNDACLRMWEGKNCQQVFCLKDSENNWINNLNTGPKIEVFNNFENRTQIAMLNNTSETSFSINIYDLITE